MKKIKLSSKLFSFGKIFNDNGFTCYLVGGALRSLIRDEDPTDYDFTTEATPQDITKMFKRVIPTGIKHGTVTVFFHGSPYEVTTFRKDGTYTNSRHPDSIKFTSSIYEDLKRRDFTINSIAYNLSTGEFLDPHNGRQDLTDHIIRAIGDPVKRFTEDGLRILRGCRFASQLNFTIEENTLIGISKCRDNLKKISAERIRDEIKKILLSDKPSIAFGIMTKTAIDDLIFPEFTSCKGVLQRGFHKFDVFHHLLMSCDGAVKNNLPVRLAALFHDIGKPEALERDSDGEPTFHKHEVYSARIAQSILRRFKTSRKMEKKVCHLIRFHMFNFEPLWTDAAIRRFIAGAGKENIDDLFLLRIADQYGMTEKYIKTENLELFRLRIKKILEQDCAFSIKDLKISGNDLAFKAGIPKGPIMGIIIENLFEAVLDDPLLNTPEKLLEIAGNLYRKITTETPDKQLE